MRRDISNFGMIINGKAINITITGGLARIEKNESLNDVISRADNAMYHGKNNGRNCCVINLIEDEMGMIKIKNKMI